MARVEMAFLMRSYCLISKHTSDALLEALSLPSGHSSGLGTCLGSKWAHVGSSLRPCSMKTTTPTPSTACARCYENSWSRPREGCSMPPNLPRKFGERGYGCPSFFADAAQT